MPRVPYRLRRVLERIAAALSALLCRLGVHAWEEFTSAMGGGSRRCGQCNRRQFRFSERWVDVPERERR